MRKEFRKRCGKNGTITGAQRFFNHLAGQITDRNDLKLIFLRRNKKRGRKLEPLLRDQVAYQIFLHAPKVILTLGLQ